MTPRERVLAAFDFRPPDKIPLQVHPSQGGLYEHGQKLLDLMRACGHDFGDACAFKMPDPPLPSAFDPDGRYHAIRTDAWGTTWQYRILGVWGHPIAWPLDDMRKLDVYVLPPPPPTTGPGLETAKAEAQRHRERYYLLVGVGSLFHKLHSLRRFDDVLVDIALDTPEMNRLADMITENMMGHVQRALAIEADGISFGDDFGTQSGLIFSMKVWRRFFRPRYKALFEPILRAKKRIFFHSCGQIAELLEEFRSLGVNAIWPQLPLFDMSDLAKRCRDLGLAVQLHPDRGDLMQRARPAEVRDYVRRMLDAFGTRSGGSWLYIEIDPGFPFANVEALFETAIDMRK
jgi:hypothetical protein